MLFGNLAGYASGYAWIWGDNDKGCMAFPWMAGISFVLMYRCANSQQHDTSRPITDHLTLQLSVC